MTVTAVQGSEPEAQPSIDADENGVRIFFPSDDVEFDGKAVAGWLRFATRYYPKYILDFMEAVDGGVLVVFVNLEAHL